MQKVLLPDNAHPTVLKNLSNKYPKIVVQNPNIDPELFAKMAIDHPLEAMKNPSLPLWLLEQPLFWDKIENDNIMNWIEVFSRELNIKDRFSFLLSCVDRVVPIFSVIPNTSKKVSEFIKMSRRYISGKVTFKQLHDTAVMTWDVADGTISLPIRAAAKSIEYCSVMATQLFTSDPEYDTTQLINSCLDWASDAKGYSVHIEVTSHDFSLAKYDEIKCHWETLRTFFPEKEDAYDSIFQSKLIADYLAAHTDIKEST